MGLGHLALWPGTILPALNPALLRTAADAGWCMVDRDVVLLEAGFITVLVSPLNFFGLHDAVWHHCHDSVAMLVVRWLLFRITFASGVAKLTSGSQSWWSLSGQCPVQCESFTPAIWLSDKRNFLPKNSKFVTPSPLSRKKSCKMKFAAKQFQQLSNSAWVQLPDHVTGCGTASVQPTTIFNSSTGR